MKKIDFFLDKIIPTKNSNIIFKKKIISIIKDLTGVDLKLDQISIKSKVLFLKIKPIKKHVILLKKNYVLDVFNSNNIFIEDIL